MDEGEPLVLNAPGTAGAVAVDEVRLAAVEHSKCGLDANDFAMPQLQLHTHITHAHIKHIHTTVVYSTRVVVRL